MSAVVHVVALDRPVKITRIEKGGDSVTLEATQHETFTVRPHEAILVTGDEYDPSEFSGVSFPLQEKPEGYAPGPDRSLAEKND